MQMLLDLMEERQKWLNQRDEAIREISRLSELIRATMNMIPAEQIARYEPIFERLENRPAGLSMAIRACFTASVAGLTWPMGLERGSAGNPQGKDGSGIARREAEERNTRGRAGESKLEAGIAGREAEERKSETLASGSAKKDWLTPVEIRDALKRMGFPFENYKANPLASIHTTLKRMVPGELETKTLRDGQKVYRLKSAGEWAEAFAEVRQWLTGSFMESAGKVVAVRRSRKELDRETAAQKEAEDKEPASGERRG